MSYSVFLLPSAHNDLVSDLLLKTCHKKQESLNHEGPKDTKEESTKGFGFSFAGKTANEKAAFLKTVARFSKNTLLTVLNLVTFVSLWFNNLLLWVAGTARVSAESFYESNSPGPPCVRIDVALDEF